MDNDHHQTVDVSHTTEQLYVENIDSYIKHIRKAIEALSDIVKRLPKVDNKGNSECPFAESLYAEKEEETTKFIEFISKLNGYIALVNREIQTFKQNLRTLSMDRHDLQLPQAQETYETAKHAYEFHYQKNIRRKEALLELSEQADEVLKETRAKKWPLGTPRERNSFPSLYPTGEANNSIIAGPVTTFLNQLDVGKGMHNEIDSLMTIGPLGR